MMGTAGGRAVHDHDHLPVAGLTRRRAMGLLGGMGVAVLAGCVARDETVASDTVGSGSGAPQASTSTAALSLTSSVASSAPPVQPTTVALPWLTPPSETGGPFPANGSNQNGGGALANVLDKAAVFRSDMAADLDGSNRQAGIALTMQIRVGHTASRTAFAGAAVYLWHCDVGGHYSAYGGGMNGGDFTSRSYLRAVGVTDAEGNVNFTSILPGRYQGRAAHIHFMVFSDRTLATRLLTSQFAFDDSEIDALYGTNPVYAANLRNATYNSRDNVFNGGVENQLLDLSGTTAAHAAINILVG